MKGKQKCQLLKSIRCKIAKENGLSYTLSECTFQGECKGTCPKCEAELQQLTKDLERLRQGGKRVAIAGIAAAMVATSAAGCTPKGEDEWDVIDHDFAGFTVEEPEDFLDHSTGDYDVDYTDGEFPEDHIEGKIAVEKEALTGDIELLPEEEDAQ